MLLVHAIHVFLTFGWLLVLAPGPGSWSWLLLVSLAHPAISHPCAPLKDDFISLLLLLLLSILIDSLDLLLILLLNHEWNCKKKTLG